MTIGKALFYRNFRKRASLRVLVSALPFVWKRHDHQWRGSTWLVAREIALKHPVNKFGSYDSHSPRSAFKIASAKPAVWRCALRQ